MTEGRLARLKSGAGARWAGLKDRHVWLRHVVSAWDLLQRNHGNEYAAAITYFSFLALFPLVLLAASVTGFILHSHPGLEQDFFNRIAKEVPGGLGTTINQAVQKAIQSRRGVGVVGLVGVLLAGLGWIGNLRGAIDGVWGRPPAQVNFFKARLANLFVLGGLGLGTVVSLGLTVVGTSLTDQILGALGLNHLPGSHLVFKLLGIAIAVAGDMIIFWWLIIRLPQIEVRQRIAIKGALLASVGFEVLKIVGTYTIAHTANSPTAGPFAGIIAVLIWIQLVARYLLFACAWTATLTIEDRAALANRIPAVERAPGADGRDAGSTITPAAVGATLVGAGAVAGAVATLTVTSGRRRSKRRT
jgi:membrane protein